ncbi:sigma-54 factor interaction domain-containing protein [Bradyrhizobium hereditatis]|uniref:sigma-54 factor interaction domain-containing protein n=1 Tax=Bradyrhizobium hereditatis TaxID=2821405 RepID=UPI002896BE97|nr:sigma-54 factor interaction domain-containing protein [Bradyrhizobium hereditatis]
MPCVAVTAAPVLLLGETGVGKEIFAQGIHAASPRRDCPFVVVTCGSVSRELLATELFGYVDGAFTGARRGGMAGKIEAAAGGSLFLDEIGELPLDLQPMLLRALETGEISRIGEATLRKVDFRLPGEPQEGLSLAETSERDLIARTLRSCNGNVAATALALGLAKSTVYAKLRRYRIRADLGTAD